MYRNVCAIFLSERLRMSEKSRTFDLLPKVGPFESTFAFCGIYRQWRDFFEKIGQMSLFWMALITYP